MKLNQKGITLVELIISMALISIVIMFLFRLLVDVRYSENNTDFNRANQQTRAVILKRVQQDFLDKKLIKIEDKTTNTNETSIDLKYKDGSTGNLTINANSLSYTINGDKEKWLLEKQTDETVIGYRCVHFSSSLTQESLKNEGEFYSVKITVPIIVNKLSKNVLDDLEFFYIGEKSDLENVETAFPTLNTLGKYDANTCG